MRSWRILATVQNCVTISVATLLICIWLEISGNNGVDTVKIEKFCRTIPLVQVIGWASFATGALTVGFFVGRNLRARYRLNHRTPYDFYSHAGDNGSCNLEYGVGI